MTSISINEKDKIVKREIRQYMERNNLTEEQIKEFGKHFVLTNSKEENSQEEFYFYKDDLIVSVKVNCQ